MHVLHELALKVSSGGETAGHQRQQESKQLRTISFGATLEISFQFLMKMVVQEIMQKLNDQLFIDKFSKRLNSFATVKSSLAKHFISLNGPSKHFRGLLYKYWVKSYLTNSMQIDGIPISSSLERLEAAFRQSNNEDLNNSLIEQCLIDIFNVGHIDFITSVLSHLPCFRDAIRSIYEDDYITQQYRSQKNGSIQKPFYQEECYPNVYGAPSRNTLLDERGRKYALPEGAERKDGMFFDEIVLGPPQKMPNSFESTRRHIKDLDILCRKTFKDYDSLNVIQSIVFDIAYNSNENMLICAPTGAGKTDTAVLTILHAIKMYCFGDNIFGNTDIEYDVLSNLKIVYVAPMKALASEIVEKFSSKLSWLQVKIREYTGDMKLSRTEIEHCNIFVTTPEKWDLITRKASNEDSLLSKVKLLIVDEVHMLQDERGSVIESIIARTFRYLEAHQTMIRVIALSATLSNYLDVADFLRVNRYSGLFYFGMGFRPCPIEQHFIGAYGKPNSSTSRDKIDIACKEKVLENLSLRKQVIVFVHSRKDTLNTSTALRDFLKDKLVDGFLNPNLMEKWNLVKNDIKRSRNQELKDLLDCGIGLHNAGMLRSDRNLVERLFARGFIKLLCCTATLAWGVNLPAYAVVIKGTQFYDMDKSKFADLAISDVLQCFGRAGRPQYENLGVAYLITTQDKLSYYVSAITQQLPIESRLLSRIPDNLNAEIALGTVGNVSDGISWLNYSYLFVRMKKSPLLYGVDYNEINEDPNLGKKLKEIVVGAAKKLSENQMIVFNETQGLMISKELGRIASEFYISHKSINIINSFLKASMTPMDILNLISKCEEFKHLKARPNEEFELKKLSQRTTLDRRNTRPLAAVSENKVLILIRAYILQENIVDFALSSEILYIEKNAPRIARAIFEISLSRSWMSSYDCLNICKCLENRFWLTDSPLKQFDLNSSSIDKFAKMMSNKSIEDLKALNKLEIFSIIRNQKTSDLIFHLLRNIPNPDVQVSVIPLMRNIVRIKIKYLISLDWSKVVNGSMEGFWFWIEDYEGSKILHSEQVLVTEKNFDEEQSFEIALPIEEPFPSQLFLHVVSDKWFGAESTEPITLRDLVNITDSFVVTNLLDLQPLPITALHSAKFEKVCSGRFQFFNAMQTQVFFSAYNTSANMLIGAPTGSGKTMAAELALFREINQSTNSKIIYVAPMKALVTERMKDWSSRLAGPLNIKILEFTGNVVQSQADLNSARIIITTPEKWDGATRKWKQVDFVKRASLVIFDEIHLLTSDRGPTLELIVARMEDVSKYMKKQIRFLGLSTAIANANDLADWLNVPSSGLFNFRHSVRPVPMEIYIDSFHGRAYCPRMALMNKPAFNAIKIHSPNKPTLIFVSSRRQTRLTAQALISLCASEENPRRYCRMETAELDRYTEIVSDEHLKLSITFGIAIHHAGLSESDRKIAEELFQEGKAQVLVATSTLAWGVNTPAHLVIIKGTEYFDTKIQGYRDMDLTDILQMLGRAGRPQFDTFGVARLFVQDTKKEFYKHFLHIGFPVESQLHKLLDDHLNSEIASKSIETVSDCATFLYRTFLYRRLRSNPMNYGLQDNKSDTIRTFFTNLVNNTIRTLAQSGCLRIFSNGIIRSTKIGEICSYYYISHLTIRNLITIYKKDFEFSDCLYLLCQAKEFDDLPVRHNEDLVNSDLIKMLPLKSPFNLPMGDPHVKALILIQCYFSNATFPITDYQTDLISMLEQSLRIVQAFIDVCAEFSDLNNVKSFVKLCQCIKIGCWPKVQPFAILPDHQTNSSLTDVKESYITDLYGCSVIKASGFAKEMDTAYQSRYEEIITKMPSIQISASTSDDMLALKIQRTSNKGYFEYKLQGSNFPRSQVEGWLAVLYLKDSGKILALRRIAKYNSDGIAKISFRLSEKFESKLEIICMSDSYCIEKKITL